MSYFPPLGVGLFPGLLGFPAFFAGDHLYLFATLPGSVPKGFLVGLPAALGLLSAIFISPLVVKKCSSMLKCGRYPHEHAAVTTTTNLREITTFHFASPPLLYILIPKSFSTMLKK
tara:strand:- start:425 stop:772 length:348 start_codon:yes stop_codon:yes gene_type:complete